ncbi:MAG: type II toxin-antitoxin system HicB family antitoxin [Burkholderiaceae bacterium]|nr:type II toxin-antitoxin system HicB family antitoxin [Burkholderiaceae bacterium]
MNILKYKDYDGSAELDMERMVCRGKILFIDDLVTYEAPSPAGLQKEFESAVDDYIETCAFLGRAPKKPHKGQFNVRIPPSLHKNATLRAIEDDVCLNDVVVRALEAYIHSRTPRSSARRLSKVAKISSLPPRETTVDASTVEDKATRPQR